MDITTDGHTLLLGGDFDVRSTWEVRNAIYEHLEGHDQDVVVDLTDVGSIDITALRVLAVATRRASLAGHRLTLRGVAAPPYAGCCTSPVSPTPSRSSAPPPPPDPSGHR